MDLPKGWRREGGAIDPAEGASPSDPYPPMHRPLVPNAPVLRVTVTDAGETSVSAVPLLVSPVGLPARSATLGPDRAVLNLAGSARSVDVTVSEVFPEARRLALICQPVGRRRQMVRSGTLRCRMTWKRGFIPCP